MIKDALGNNGNGKLNDNKIAILKEHFPNCFSGDTLDIEKFKKEINQELDFSSEGYELNFLGKNYAKYIADTIDTETVLTPDIDHNKKEKNANSNNIYITGDNLDILKHLRKSYTNRIKMIYIDPPYNTGSDGFVYKDNFNFTVDQLKVMLGIENEEAERVINMTSSNSSSHSAWLTFMYPRLFLARELLKDDGVVFISIDDFEYAQLKMLCDDIFGEENFLASLTRRTKAGGGSAAHHFAVEHDYILVYGKNKTEIDPLFVPYDEEYLKRYSEEDDVGKFYWDTMERSYTQTTPYLIEAPDGTMLEGNWFRSEKTFLADKERGDVRIIETKNGWSVQFKQRIAKGKKIRSILHDNIYKSSQDDLEELGLKGVFDHPKPTELINQFIIASTSKENDIVLDFFSGSGTTAESVLKVNSNDNMNRKYIMVQIDEPVKKGSVAEKQGYKTIDEIGRERIIRAAEKIKDNTNVDIDYGFKHFYAKEIDKNVIDKIKDFNPTLLASDLEVEFDKETILTTWMNQDGHGLTPTVEEVNLGGYTGYYVHDYLYLVDKGLSQKHIDSLLSKIVEEKNFNPTSVVIYGYNFTDFNILTQLEMNLKQLRYEEKSIEVSLIKRY